MVESVSSVIKNAPSVKTRQVIALYVDLQLDKLLLIVIVFRATMRTPLIILAKYVRTHVVLALQILFVLVV